MAGAGARTNPAAVVVPVAAIWAAAVEAAVAGDTGATAPVTVAVAAGTDEVAEVADAVDEGAAAGVDSEAGVAGTSRHSRADSEVNG